MPVYLVNILVAIIAATGAHHHKPHPHHHKPTWAQRVTLEAERSPMVLCIEWRESTSTPHHLRSPDTNPGQTGLAQWDQNAWDEDDVYHYASTPMRATDLQQEAVLVWAIAHGRSYQWTPFDGCTA